MSRPVRQPKHQNAIDGLPLRLRTAERSVKQAGMSFGVQRKALSVAQVCHTCSFMLSRFRSGTASQGGNRPWNRQPKPRWNRTAWTWLRRWPRFGGNEALLLKYLRRFPSDPNYADLESALLRGDGEALRAACHTLKGVSGTLGLTPAFHGHQRHDGRLARERRRLHPRAFFPPSKRRTRRPWRSWRSWAAHRSTARRQAIACIPHRKSASGQRLSRFAFGCRLIMMLHLFTHPA